MITNSTVRLDVNKELPNYRTPWSVGGTTNSSATVSVLKSQEKMYLVTNAHAVMDATYLKIKLNDFSQEIPVKTCWVDPVLDLAILQTTTPEAETFLVKSLNPLPITSEFQKQGTEVFAYGYPAGGRSLSFTKGHISRVELTTMSLSQQAAITVQTSAPINPGNSGGPITCMIDEHETCIGIVAQAISSLQNTGYFIPAISVIDTIKRYEKYKQFKEIGIIDFITSPTVLFSWQSLKNPTLREAIGLPKLSLGEELTGILVTDVADDSCAYNLLKNGDIIQSIDGYSVQSNGEIKVPSLEYPVSFRFAILRKNYLDNIIFSILRNGKDEQLEKMEINILLSQQLGQHIASPDYQMPLKYHIQPSGKKGGYVFIRYTSSYRASFFGIPNFGPPGFFSGLHHLTRKTTREIVILQNIIPSEETDGYNSFPVTSGSGCMSHRVVEANKQPIHCLYDLITALSDTSKISEVKFENGRILYIAPANDETLENLKKSHHVRFFSSSQSSPVSPNKVIDELKGLGERENNQYEHLKKVKTVCASDLLSNRLFSEQESVSQTHGRPDESVMKKEAKEHLLDSAISHKMMRGRV